ncbi:hypothetical protein [Mobilicoccus caccae]|uniref:hypothetical protein n=1 Tax=Mobilicoccus caccae TaxID=1859295 RepID=UPI0024E095C2|nr:hypothetical protein [Mobilicoccus caccae]
MDTVLFLGFAGDRGAAPHPGDDEGGGHEHADVPERGIHRIHEGVEPDEAHGIAGDTGDEEDPAMTTRASGGQSTAKRVEHSDGGVEDHREDDDHHDVPEDRMDARHEFEHRDVGLGDLRDIEIQRDAGQQEQHRVEQAAGDPTCRRLAQIRIVAADDQAHGHGQQESQAGVVEGGKPPGSHRRAGLCCGGVQPGQVRRQVEHRVGESAHHGHDDQRSHARDDRGHLVDVEQSGGHDERGHDSGARPGGESVLLLQG